MATIQVRVDDQVKTAVDSLFTSLGLDTSTAVRIFLTTALNYGGLPFLVRRNQPNAELREALQDVKLNRNLHGPFATVDEAMKALLDDDAEIKPQCNNPPGD